MLRDFCSFVHGAPRFLPALFSSSTSCALLRTNCFFHDACWCLSSETEELIWWESAKHKRSDSFQFFEWLFKSIICFKLSLLSIIVVTKAFDYVLTLPFPILFNSYVNDTVVSLPSWCTLRLFHTCLSFAKMKGPILRYSKQSPVNAWTIACVGLSLSSLWIWRDELKSQWTSIQKTL